MKRLALSLMALAFTASAYAQTIPSITNFPIPGPALIEGNHLNQMVSAINNLTGHGTASNVTAARFYAGNGTVALPSFTFTTDPDTGIYRIGANNLGVAAAGAKVLDVGTTGLGVTGVLTSGAHTITSASATALTVGLNGATTPALLVDASTAVSITGIKIKSAATGGGVAISAIGEASNGALTLDAQGSGTITLGGTSTGNIVLTRATTGLSYSGTGLVTGRSGTATPAAASAVASFCMGSSSICIYWGTGTPNTALTAAKGSLFIATDGSSSSTRMFVNTDGSTAWAAVTTAS